MANLGASWSGSAQFAQICPDTTDFLMNVLFVELPAFLK